MNILFLSRWFPLPADNGSKIRIINLLRSLAQNHTVTLISFYEGDRPAAIPAELARLCSKVIPIRLKPFEPHTIRARLGFFSPQPRSLRDTFSPAMAAAIRDELNSHSYQLVIASQWQMAGYAPYFSGTPALFEEIELAVYYDPFRKATSPLQRLRHGLTWFKHRRFIGSLAYHFQAATVVSKEERSLLHETIPPYRKRPVLVVPNGLDLDSYRPAGPAAAHHKMIFTGSFRYWPNYEAMDWFLKEVYGRVKAAIPQVTLQITGDHAGRELPPAEGVTLSGYVDDIHAAISEAAISLAPMLSGGGTRLKILEAFALQTPVIATSKGAEGLEITDGVHLLIADTPEDFAAATIRLLQDKVLRARLAQNAYQLVQERYSWEKITPDFVRQVEHIGIVR